VDGSGSIVVEPCDDPELELKIKKFKKFFFWNFNFSLFLFDLSGWFFWTSTFSAFISTTSSSRMALGESEHRKCQN
jgi:hypothetical protein